MSREVDSLYLRRFLADRCY